MNTETSNVNVNDAPATGHNANPNESYIKLAKDASKLIGDSAAGADKGLTVLTAATVMLYQTDDYYRAKMDAVIKSRVESKITSKTAKEAATSWLHTEFELVKPTSKAMSLAKFKFNNREQAHIKAFKRAADYYKQGLRFTVDEKTKRIYITSESYRKVTKDTSNSGNVEVVAKAGASSDRLTFSSLESGKPTPKSTGTSKPITVTATANNIKVLCQATKVACESATPEKLDGSERVAALDAFFALQIMLGAKEDAAMVKAYEELTKAQAA